TTRSPDSVMPTKRAGSPPSRFGVTADATSPYRFSSTAFRRGSFPPAHHTESWIRQARTNTSSPNRSSARRCGATMCQLVRAVAERIDEAAVPAGILAAARLGTDFGATAETAGPGLRRLPGG